MVVMVWLAAGCAAPISNAPFLEEAEFLGALPSADRFGPPANVFLAPAAENVVLSTAKVSATEYQQLFAFPIAVGDALRGLEPAERSDLRRTWAESEVLLTVPAVLGDVGTRRAWVRASVERPAGDGDLDLSISLAPDPSGPWAEVAHGDYDGAGAGTLTFELGETAEVLDLEPPTPLATLSATFDDHGYEEWDRYVEATYGFELSIARVWVVASDLVFGFSGLLEVTDDGAALPGGATVVETGAGGWAIGAVVDLTGELQFETCWDTFGSTQYIGGDAGIQSVGSADRCIDGALDAR